MHINICFKVIALTLWSHPSAYAQYADQTENSHGGVDVDGQEHSALNSTVTYPGFQSKLFLPTVKHNTGTSTQLSRHSYSQNSGDSFAYGDTPENHLCLQGKDSRNQRPQLSEISTMSTTSTQSSTSKNFCARLFDNLSTKTQHENLAYSPVSLQTLLTFFFNSSAGKLHEELAQLLAFENILQSSPIDSQHATVVMANKLYYDYHFGAIDQRVRDVARASFSTELEQVNFFESKLTADSINSWISNKTHNLIKEIVTSSSFSGETSALVLNSIYFKSEWQRKFSPQDTEKQDFFLSQSTKVLVDMMYNEDVFRYADFSDELQASVVELPYKTSNLSMLLILPLDIEGLPNLEKKLGLYDFNTISQKLKREIVTVKLPKFQIAYEIDMKAALQEMGLHALFNNDGVFNLFKNAQKPLKVDQFKHKCFINVNEAGTEAAATTVVKYVPLSVPSNMKYFVADHPFVFVIRNKNTTFFMGHVVRF